MASSGDMYRTSLLPFSSRAVQSLQRLISLYGLPGRSDSTATPPVNSATTLPQKRTAPGTPLDARTIQRPGRRSQRSIAARQPTPERRSRRITKNSATSKTFGSSLAGEPRVANANPTTRESRLIRNGKWRSGSGARKLAPQKRVERRQWHRNQPGVRRGGHAGKIRTPQQKIWAGQCHRRRGTVLAKSKESCRHAACQSGLSGCGPRAESPPTPMARNPRQTARLAACPANTSARLELVHACWTRSDESCGHAT